VIDEYVWNNKSGLAKIGRLTNANMSFGMSFDSKKEKKETKGGSGPKETEKPKGKPIESEQYMPFNMPWRFNFNYSLLYTNSYRPDKNGEVKGHINQSLSLGGQVTITEKWNMDVNTNFDIQAMKFSFTTINLSRNLHCWGMSFNFVPFGDRKSYSFNISASSAMLRDLKLQRQSSWRDNY